jgi:hypothetical protein
MSTKENLDFVKKELSQEEKFLETSMKLEGFWKKYKMAIFAVGAFIFMGTALFFTNDYLKERDLLASNEAYVKLLKNPDDKASLELLETKNPKLYDAYVFQMAMRDSNIDKLNSIANKNIDILSSLATLQVALIEKDIDKLNKYSLKDKALIKEYATIQEAFLLIEKEEYKKAQSRLDSIPIDSQVANFSNALKHYLITK